MLLLPADDNDPAVLLRRADMAMYVAKTHGKNGFRFFSEAIDARVRGDLALEAGLRQALRLAQSTSLQDQNPTASLVRCQRFHAGIEAHQHAVMLRGLPEENGIRPLPMPLEARGQ